MSRLRVGDWAVVVAGSGYFDIRSGSLVEVIRADSSDIPFAVRMVAVRMVLQQGDYNDTGYWFHANELDKVDFLKETPHAPAAAPPSEVSHPKRGLQEPR